MNQEYRPMPHRTTLLITLSLALFAIWASPTVVSGQGIGPGQQITLRDLLLKGLKVRFPDERTFVVKVVDAVGEGKLDEGLVKAVYRAATAKNSRYPFPYFRVMMKRIAAKQGVTLVRSTRQTRHSLIVYDATGALLPVIGELLCFRHNTSHSSG